MRIRDLQIKIRSIGQGIEIIQWDQALRVDRRMENTQ